MEPPKPPSSSSSRQFCPRQDRSRHPRERVVCIRRMKHHLNCDGDIRAGLHDGPTGAMTGWDPTPINLAGPFHLALLGFTFVHNHLPALPMTHLAAVRAWGPLGAEKFPLSVLRLVPEMFLEAFQELEDAMPVCAVHLSACSQHCV